MYFLPWAETGVFITVLHSLVLATFPSKPVISWIQNSEGDGPISLPLLDISYTLLLLEKTTNGVKEARLSCLGPVLKCSETVVSPSN